MNADGGPMYGSPFAEIVLEVRQTPSDHLIGKQPWDVRRVALR